MTTLSPSIYNSTSNPLLSVALSTTNSYKTEHRIIGAVLEFFGIALKVEQTNGNTEYVRISELKNKLILRHIENKEELKTASKDAIIHDLFLSTINPLKNKKIKLETLNQFEQQLAKTSLHYSSSDPKQFYSALRGIRAAIHTQQGATQDLNAFIANIQVGDIIFHRTDDTVHSDIVQFQRIANILGFGPRHRDAVHHNHVYLCAKIDKLGKRWFAEAAWPNGKLDEIRLISEDDVNRCFLKQNHGAISELFRCNNPELAKRAAKEARKVTTKLPPLETGNKEQHPTALRYSIKDGALALFTSNKFGHFAKMRLIQQIRSTNEGGQPIEFVQHKAFFCSSLVGYSYQVGEARSMVTEMLGNNEEGSPLKNRIHSNFLAIRHAETLDRDLQFKIDPKRSAPGDLYTYLFKNKQLFTAIQSYQQPNIDSAVSAQ